MRFFPIIFAGVAMLALLTGCSDEEKAEAPAPVRAIKTIVVSEHAKDQQRLISGVVEAATVTDLSFETGGQVVKINVDIGDAVAKGDVVAELDTEPYKLKVDTARSELDSAIAKLADAKEKFAQQKTLMEKGFTTKTSFDSATATMKTSESQLKIQETKLTLAQRDLRKTKLLAPFDGRIAKKYAEVFTELGPGEKVVQLNSEGRLKVEVSVPENLVRELKAGDRVSISFPTLQTLKTGGTISEIGSRAEAANAFPVNIALDQQFPELRPGMSAQVTIRFSTAATGNAFLLPMTAILAQSKTDPDAIVFVYDESAGVVRERKVKVLNVRDNELEVEGDFKEGEIIAVAGVSFLSDGMKVRLLDPAQAQPK